MRIEFHPAVEKDFSEAYSFYLAISERLAQEFQQEFRHSLKQAAVNPSRFHRVRPDIHRMNLRRFPFHVIYRKVEGGIRVILLRHHRRNPEYGMTRS